MLSSFSIEDLFYNKGMQAASVGKVNIAIDEYRKSIFY